MPFVIRSGGNLPHEAEVTKDGQLKADAAIRLHEAYISEVKEELYRVGMQYTISGAGSFMVGTFENTDPLDRNILIFDVAFQWFGLSGGAAIPNANNYMTVVRNVTFSGGDLVDEYTNMNMGASKGPQAILRENNPTVTGTPDEGQKSFLIAAAGAGASNMGGALVIPRGVSVGMKLYTDNTAGFVAMLATFGFHEPH